MADFKPIDVFLDIENFGMRAHKEGRGKIRKFIPRLLAALHALGYQPREMWSASAAAGRDYYYEQMVTDIMRTYGVQMQWSQRKPSADFMLMREMRRQLKDDTLAPEVLLLTGDADFNEVVREVVDSGRRLIVTNRNPQRSWGVRLKATPYANAVRQDGD